jgi:hypothetical protein
MKQNLGFAFVRRPVPTSQNKKPQSREGLRLFK